MSTIQPGNDGDPLPGATLVFRVGRNASLSPAALATKKASPEMFELSTEDKKAPVPRLSVWVEELTIADQAWGILGAKPSYTVVACLNVNDIHGIVPPSGFLPLKAEWEQAMTEDKNGNKIPNRSPGADGHAGIANLNQGNEKNKDHKNKRKELRSMLADAARLSPVPVPHNIPQEQIEVAAYYIAEKAAWNGRIEEHWVQAIRQLRRTRVQLG